MRNMDPPDSHMGDKNSNSTALTMKKSVLDVFSGLNHGSDSKRNEACILLVQRLLGNTETESEDGLSSELKYCVKRLIRGLGSSKPLVQKGYFTALVGILSSFNNIPFEVILDIVSKELQVSSSSKKEEGDTIIGRSLVWGAVVHSGAFSRIIPQQLQQIVSDLITCSKKKTYMPFVTSSILIDLIEKVEEKQFSDTIWPVLKVEVSKTWEDQTLDSLLLLLISQKKGLACVKSKFLNKCVGSSELLAVNTMEQFAQKLVNVNSPLILTHPLYEAFCREICDSKDISLLQQFWTVGVDKQLSTPNHNKDIAALHILVLLLQNLENKEHVEVLVTNRVLDLIGRTIRKSPSEKARNSINQNKARQAMALLGDVLTKVEVSSKVRFSVLSKILFGMRTLQYEKQTGTHLVILLESKLNFKCVQKLAKKFQEVIKGSAQSSGETWTNKDRKFAVQQLTRLIGHSASQNEIDWKVDQLMFLLSNGIMRGSKESGNIGVELAATIKQSFFRALDQKFSSLESCILALDKIVENLNGIISMTSSETVLRTPLSEEALVSWKKMIQVVSTLKEKKASQPNGKGSAAAIFHTLFLHMGLQLLADASMASEALEELHCCYERLGTSKKSANKEEEPEWVEVAVDLFLSLLSHDSHLLRTIIYSVFPHVCRHLSASAFCQILEVLDPAQNETPLSKPESIDSESDSASDLSEQDDDNESDDDENIDEEEEEDDEEQDSFEEDETVNDKLRMDVRHALGNAASLTDTESVDLDEIDEEEGRRMNTALAQAFKTLRDSRSKKKSKKQSKTDETLTHFRIRVIGLVELYLTREPGMALCLEAISPLLSLLTFCIKDNHQNPLENKVRSVLHKLASLKKFSSAEGVTDGNIAELLTALVEKGNRSAAVFLSIANHISECCVFLVRCSEIISQQNKRNQKSTVEVYKNMLSDFFDRRDTLLPVTVFRPVFALMWKGNWDLVPLLVEYAFDSNVRPFRKGQALELLLIFYRNNCLLNSASREQKEILKKLETDLSNKCATLLTDLASNAGNVRHHFVAELLRLLIHILSRGTTHSLDKSALSSSLVAFCKSTSGVTSETKRVLLPLSKLLNCEIGPIKNLRSASRTTNGVENNDTDDEDEDDPRKERSKPERQKKKKKKRNDSLTNGEITKENHRFDGENGLDLPSKKTKKQKKIERMALMAEGLETIPFSSMDIDDAEMNDVEPEQTKEKPKVKNTLVVNGNHTPVTAAKRKSSSHSFSTESKSIKNIKKKKSAE